MSAPALGPEDEAGRQRDRFRARADLLKRFPEMFTMPASSGDIAMVLDALDEIAGLLKRRDTETASLTELLRRLVVNGGR